MLSEFIEELKLQLAQAHAEIEELKEENAALWSMLDELKEADKALMNEIVGLAMSEMTPKIEA